MNINTELSFLMQKMNIWYTNITTLFIFFIFFFLKYYQQESAKLRQQIISIQNSNRLILSNDLKYLFI